VSRRNTSKLSASGPAHETAASGIMNVSCMPSTDLSGISTAEIPRLADSMVCRASSANETAG